MRWWKELTFVLRRLNRKTAEGSLDEEIRAHLDLETEARLESGADPANARAEAQKAFGSASIAREDARAAWGFTWVESGLKDFRYGVRVLLRSPGFTLSASLSLALAIGANAVVFSAVYGVLLRPLPFKHPDKVVAVKSLNLKSPMTLWGGASPADFADFKKQNTCFEAIAADGGGGAKLTLNGRTEVAPGARVSEDFFDVFGTAPLLG
ncbi:MAG TPA: permease prefix domain 1-containing protein, partial [Blastocatellia bacterium]|nr:permease prefix domain 1-containing protein [Blastocatellia bacterium]